jgi:hypothetical protein
VPKRLIEAQIFDWLKSMVRQASHPNNYLLKISRQSTDCTNGSKELIVQKSIKEVYARNGCKTKTKREQ